MAGYYADRIKETSLTTGTGDVTLEGAEPSFAAFSARFPVDQPFFYAIVQQLPEVAWEVGEGHLSDATTLVRARVLASTNADALVDFGIGIKDVFNTFPAESAEHWEGATLALASGFALP